MHQCAPADSVLVLLQRLVHPLARDSPAVGVGSGLLQLHVFAEIGIPLDRPVHHHPLEADGESRRYVAVGLDLLVGVVVLEAELAPAADVAVAAATATSAAGASSASRDRKSTRLNSSHSQISYAVFCLKKKKKL